MTYKLTYFNLTALAEPIRFLLSYMNVDFEDIRIEHKKWPSIKQNMPFGKLPVLEVDGNVIGQSIAIARYLANKAGLAGNDDWESLMIDMVIGNIDDLRSAMASYAYDPVEESKSRKFSPLINEMVPYYMTTFENTVIENDGFFVNGKLSWADIYFVALLDYMHFMVKCDFLENCPKLNALKDQVLSIPQIKLWLEKRPASVP